MKIKKIFSVVLLIVMVMSLASFIASAIETQPYCPDCGGTLWRIIIRESPNCIQAGVYLEDCMVCDYFNTIPIPGSHIDENGDKKCDKCRESLEEEKPVIPEEPETPEVPDAPSDTVDNCSCNCHKKGILGFFYKILIFFQKFFGQNKVCACGIAH